MPSYLYGTKLTVDGSGTGWYNVRFCAEAEGVLELEFGFEELFGAEFFAFGPFLVPLGLSVLFVYERDLR
jgi:hypothetical protein